jgi:hypothetical protein
MLLGTRHCTVAQGNHDHDVSLANYPLKFSQLETNTVVISLGGYRARVKSQKQRAERNGVMDWKDYLCRKQFVTITVSGLAFG